MIIYNQTGLEKITTAINYFQVAMPDITEALKKLPGNGRDFTYTDRSNLAVVFELEHSFRSSMAMKVVPWWPKNIFTSAIATTFASEPDKVYINMRKAHLFNYRDYSNTIAHEFCHLIGFSHGEGIAANFVTTEKLKSVPFAVGNLVSGESNYPLVSDAPRMEIPQNIGLICYRDPKWLWLRKKCVPASELTN
jgi:hypothetical protein